jgi:hypothetical protein
MRWQERTKATRREERQPNAMARPWPEDEATKREDRLGEI